MNPTLNATSVPAQLPFLDTLAGWILAEYGPDPALLAKTLILLPNRRACRSLRDIFLKLTGGKPILLPRMQPIGEVDGEAAFFSGSDELPEAIVPLRRQLLLTGLVVNFERERQGHRYDVAQASQLATRLAQLIDDAAREGLDFSALEKLVPEELASHWQQTLSFLKIVSHHWPKLLAEEGAVDPATHRNLLLAEISRKWRENPPGTPVIAAGSTGTHPATANLLATIARMKGGVLVLPGLDKDMPDEQWRQVSETHPQYALKQLLEHLKCKREDIKNLGDGGNAGRATCLQAVLATPGATALWRQSKPPLDGLAGVKLLEADTLLDEAVMIAIALREVLETPGKTAALITPDRSLARMVAASMQRFGIALDDSAGRLLKNTPAGCLLQLSLDMAESQASPASLLALLRHPLAAAGVDPAECRRLSRELEISQLRGIRKTPGLDALAKAASGPLKTLLENLSTHAKPLMVLLGKQRVSFAELLKTHLDFTQWLAGEERLWAGEAGNHLSSYFAELLSHAELLPAIDPHSYSALFGSLLGAQSYWPSYGLHPRLHILSPMEARLQQFDLTILGGLNEGTWPALPEPDPWMSRPMREQFGLPPLERSIGQSAHDFMLLACAPEVLLTRARKVEGTPSIPSRWLVRFKTLVRGLDPSVWRGLSANAHFEALKSRLDAAAALEPIEAPSPKPPLEARPRKLNVTAIDTWLRDPYVIYARHILELSSLPALDREPDARDFGKIIHKALEDFTRLYPKQLPPDARIQLLKCGEAAFANYIDRPAVASLWWPRFEAMVDWLVDIESGRRASLSQVEAELKGECDFDVDGKPFRLTTRIDRLETGSGAATLIDYKTGSPPKPADRKEGLANQLPLGALVVANGTLTPPPQKAPITKLEYWKLSGNEDKCGIDEMPVSDIAAAHERLLNLIRRFDNANEPYAAQENPALKLKPEYNDYEHLTRRAEWEEF